MRYFVFLIILLSSSSCKKPTDDPKIYYLDDSIDDYVLFPEGSWWVYEEETTGDKDTLTVIKLFRTIPPADSEIGPYERASLRVESTFYLDTFQYSCRASSKNSSTLFYGGGQFYIYTTKLNNGESDNTYYVKRTYYEYDSLQIGSVFYYDIRRLENYKDVPGGVECNENFTNAYGIGVVQRATCEGLIWNLIDYHINE